MGEWRYSSTILGLEWSASRPCRFTPGEWASDTHWIGGWVAPEPVWPLWRKEKVCSAGNRARAVQPVCMCYIHMCTNMYVCKYVCMHMCKYVCICTSLSPELMDGFYYYSIFKSICRRSTPGEYEYSSSRNRGTSNEPARIKWRLSRKRLYRFRSNFCKLWRPSPWTNLHRRDLQEDNCKGTRDRNVDFESKPTLLAKTDFVVFRYSVTNNGLMSINRFRFQGNVIEVSRL
jgi:hypothetical protein